MHNVAITGHTDGVRVFDIASGKEVCLVKSPSPIIDLAFDQSTGKVITGTLDGCVRMWNLQKEQSLVKEMALFSEKLGEGGCL